MYYGNPLLYAQQFGLVLWLRADMGIQYGATLRATGTAPPAWTISGTATSQVGLHMEIDDVSAGTGLGDATYKWSIDNGATYEETGVPTDAGPTALGTTGLSVAMAAGPYNVNNKYDITVAQWNDQSGNGNHVVQATANSQPLFIVNHASFGSLPVLQFDGAQTMAKSWSLLSQPITYIFTFRPTNISSRAILSAPGTNMLFQLTGSTVQQFAGAIFQPSVATMLNTTTVLACRFNGASSSIIRNVDTTYGTGDVGSGQSDGIEIGTFHSTNFFLGQLADVMVFNAFLPDNVVMALQLGDRARMYF